MLHAGVLKKFGLYGLLRIALPMLPEGARHWAWLLIILLLGNIIYVGLVTIAQKRLDWMLGYSSVMHMGYIFLGIASGNRARHERRRHPDVRAWAFDRAALRHRGRSARSAPARLQLADLGGLAQGDAARRVRFRAGRFCFHRPARLRQFRRRSNGFLRRVPQRRGHERASTSSKSRRVLALVGRGHFRGLHAARVSRDFHGHDAGTLGRDCRYRGRDSACPIALLVAALLWIGFFPQTFVRRADADVSATYFSAANDRARLILEIAVVVLGLRRPDGRGVRGEDRQALARDCRRSSGSAPCWSRASFSRRRRPPHATGFWSFYTADPLAIFFKRFALVTTILVLIMMIDYAPVVRQSIHGATHQGGLGEFFALPLFTCAGLMWMASAVDFVMIFVSLEVVTMSFYVLVAFTRRNPVELEAGVKYLILSALSTGFLVYGITWIFGVTGETNLARITDVLARRERRAGPAALRDGARAGRARLQDRRGAIPNLGAGCLSRRADAGDRVSLGRLESGGFVVLLRVLEPFFMLPQMQRLLVVVAALTLIYGNLAALPQTNLKRLLAYSSIAHAGYLLVGVVCFAGHGGRLLSRLLSAHDDAELRRAVIVVANQTGDRIEDFNGLANARHFSPSPC